MYQTCSVKLYLSVPFPIILTLITYLPNAEKLDAAAQRAGERVPPDLKWDFCSDDFVDFETYASSLPYGMRTLDKGDNGHRSGTGKPQFRAYG